MILKMHDMVHYSVQVFSVSKFILDQLRKTVDRESERKSRFLIFLDFENMGE